MKKLTLLSAVTLLSVSLSACNKDEENVTNVPENTPVEETGTNNQTATNQTVESPYNFTSFDLNVDYSGNQEFDVDYDSERNGVEADYKDDRSNENLKGDEAFAVVRPIFEKLTFDKDTPDEEVISEVRNAFNLSDDYQNFELDVKFLDGVEKEYKVTK